MKINLQLRKKFKEKIVDKTIRYWTGVIKDYREVFGDIGKMIRENPAKSTMCFGLMGFCSYAVTANPTEVDFRDQMIENQNLFGLVGKPVRNPGVEVYLKFLQNAYNYGLIRRFSLGLFSIIWLDDYDDSLGLYKAQCPYLKPQYEDFYERIIDIGFLHRFWMMEKKMVDYDVNPNEWLDFSKNEYVYKDRTNLLQTCRDFEKRARQLALN